MRMKPLDMFLKTMKSREQYLKHPYSGSKIFMENWLQWEEFAWVSVTQYA